MNIETCYKYFEFLNSECDRYLKDHTITEDEISQMKIEFDRFLKKVNESDLPTEIKNKITNLKLDYVYTSKRESLAFVGFLIFGRSAKYRREQILKNKVEDFRFQIKGLPMFIKMNYSFE